MNLIERIGKRRAGFEIDMTNGPLLGKIVRFAIPLALSGILQLLFNAADIVVVGQFVGPTALAAVGSTSAVINLIVNLFMGFSVGANVLAAQYYGAGKNKDLSETVHTAVLSSLAFGVALIFAGVALSRPMLELMGTPADVLDQAVLYMRIYFVGMPVMMLYNFGAAILRAVGDTQRPLYFLLLAGVINVILNLVFVIVFHMGVEGVAIPTVISQCVSAGLVFWCLTKVEGPYRLYPKHLTIKKDKLLGMVKIGLPAGIQGCSFSISNVLIQSSINSFGSIAMAGNTAGSNIEGFISTAQDAFTQAAISFTGQNLGAGKLKRVDRVLLLCMLLAPGVGLVLSILAVLCGGPLLGIYSSDPEVIQYGMLRLTTVSLLQPLGALMGVTASVLRGMGYSTVPMIVTMSSVCGFRVIWIFTVFQAFPTLQVLYLSYPITWGLAALFNFIFYFVVRKRTAKKLGLAQEK